MVDVIIKCTCKKCLCYVLVESKLKVCTFCKNNQHKGNLIEDLYALGLLEP